MTSLDVRFDAHEMERRLKQFELLLSDLRSLWPSVVPIFIRWLSEQFSTEGAWGGDPWAPLAPSTVAFKQKHFPGRGILYASGDLRRAASRPKRTATPRTLTLSIEDDKAGYHQEGTSRMPARPIIPARLPMSAQRDLDHAAEEYVSDLVRRLGLAA